MNSDKATPELQTIDFEKADNFKDSYANNVLLQSSLWDIRLIFGNLDQQISMNTVVQYESVTLPWAQAKVLHYFLGMHLASHEINNGRIQIPPGIIGPISEHPPAEVVKLAPPKMEEVHEALKKIYQDFISENPEAVQKS